MKKLLLLFLIGISTTVLSQDSFIKMDGTIGGASTIGNLKSYGISAGVEPKFFFNSQLSLGLRLEGAALFGGKIDDDTENFQVGMSSRAAQLIKLEYYLTDTDNRLFFGAMFGRYTQANIGAASSGSASIGAAISYGFAPEVGITFNDFRISAIYHLVTGTDLISVDVNVGNAVKVSRNYFVIHMGWKIFQLD